jgi:hypothetical protein
LGVIFSSFGDLSLTGSSLLGPSVDGMVASLFKLHVEESSW